MACRRLAARRPMIPAVLKEVRSLRVALIHPRDRDGEELLMQLRRIGCHAQAAWPPPAEPPANADVVIFHLHDGLENAFPWNREDPPAALVVITDYENPTTLQAVLDYNPQTVIGKPIRAAGVLTNIVLARNIFRQQRQLKSRIEKLAKKLDGLRCIERAKQILINRQNITEREAYEIIRTQAMSQRVTTEAVAAAIIDAEEILTASSQRYR